MANFVEAAQAGFQSGQAQAQPNALGQFVKGMLAQHQKKKETSQAFQQEIGLSIAKEGIKSMFSNKVSDKNKFLKQLWTQAGADVFKELGGSLFAGLKKNKEQFPKLRKKRFKELATSFGVGGDLKIPGEIDTEGLAIPEPEQDIDNIDIIDFNF